MKYISFIFFAVLMAWTWNVIHSEASVSFETHSGIQEKLAALIESTIKAKKPDATDIVVEKVWTEFINQKKLKAFFVYSFKAPSSEGGIATQIHGEALLEKEESSSNSDLNEERWHLSKVKTSSDIINFSEGTLVTPGPESTGTPYNVTPGEKPKENPAQENKEDPTGGAIIQEKH